MRVLIASDHAGYPLKKKLVEYLEARADTDLLDLGTQSEDSCDYPDQAETLARQLLKEDASSLGVLICGSGAGICMAANKLKGTRAGQAWNPEIARLIREHNHARIICFGARLISEEIAKASLEAFLLAKPDEGERHLRRIKKIAKLEEVD